MASTMAATVSNNIGLASKYVPLLDELYKDASKTAVLDTPDARVRWAGAKTVYVYKMTTNGLGNYGRNSGFVPGENDGTWEALQITVDRGRSFTTDVMDEDSTMGMAFAPLLAEFEKVDVIPETDCYRLSKYFANAGHIDAPATIANTNMVTALDDAQAYLDDKEVPREGRILFVCADAYKKLKSGITRMVLNGEGNIQRNVEIYDDMEVVRVPKGRFNTICTLATPSDSSTAGGYTAAGADIMFMIVHPSAVLQVVKHLVPRIFSPEVNQEADAWKLNYRIYHDCWVLDNKKDGVYAKAITPATAMTISSATSSVVKSSTATITVSNPVGKVTLICSNDKITAAEADGTITITAGADTGSATLTVKDSIGQSLDCAVTITAS